MKPISSLILQRATIFLLLALMVVGPSFAQSPSEKRQHEQARSANAEEPQLWGDLVGMEFEGGAVKTEPGIEQPVGDY